MTRNPSEKPRELHTENMMTHFPEEIDNSPSKKQKASKIFWLKVVTNITEVFWKNGYKILEYWKEAACFFSLAFSIYIGRVSPI